MREREIENNRKLNSWPIDLNNYKIEREREKEKDTGSVTGYNRLLIDRVIDLRLPGCQVFKAQSSILFSKKISVFCDNSINE